MWMHYEVHTVFYIYTQSYGGEIFNLFKADGYYKNLIIRYIYYIIYNRCAYSLHLK